MIIPKNSKPKREYRELEYLYGDSKDIIQLRIVEATGAEKFAEFIFKKLNTFVRTETNDRVHIKRVEFMEHNKNTAIYEH